MEAVITSNISLEDSFARIERLAHRLVDWGDFRIYRRQEGTLRLAYRGQIGRADRGERALLTPIDAKVAPVHQPMRQPLDPGERVLEADVARDHRFHGVDLVQLFGGDRLFERVLEEQAQGAEGRRHEHPRERRPVAHRPNDDAGGDHGRAVADALVPQNEETLVLLQLATDDQGEVEQQPADNEIREAEEEQRGYELHVQAGRRHVRELQGTGVDAVAPEQRDHLAPQIHQSREEHLLLP